MSLAFKIFSMLSGFQSGIVFVTKMQFSGVQGLAFVGSLTVCSCAHQIEKYVTGNFNEHPCTPFEAVNNLDFVDLV
jgi:hypothetical protein